MPDSYTDSRTKLLAQRCLHMMEIEKIDRVLGQIEAVQQAEASRKPDERSE